MNQELIKKIKLAAANDLKLRRDPRYLRAMGFLIKKGFLRANQDFRHWERGKLRVQDAIWAGQNLEPRILEVLPATVARFPKEIVMNENAPKNLLKAVTALKKDRAAGPIFFGIKYDQYKVWMQLSLKDKRTKTKADKKIMRSFRLHRASIDKLKELAQNRGVSEAEMIESLLVG